MRVLQNQGWAVIPGEAQNEQAGNPARDRVEGRPEQRCGENESETWQAIQLLQRAAPASRFPASRLLHGHISFVNTAPHSPEPREKFLPALI